MMKIRRSVVLCVVSCVLLFSTSALLAARPTIAVLDFTADKDTITFGHGFIVRETVESSTKFLTSELMTFLVKANKFDVVERNRMKDILTEQEFSESGYISPETAVKLGKLIGADYFVMGKIEQFQAGIETKKIPYTDQVQQQYKGKLTVNVRIVDSRGGKVVTANKFVVEHEDRNRNNEVTPDDFLDALKEQSVKAIVNGIVEGVFPLKIIKLEGSKVYINRGAGVSFKVGDVLTVLVQGEGLVDPDTGESLGSAEKEVGRVEVDAIQKKFSTAKILTGAGQIKEGAIVRLGEQEPEAVQEREMTPGSSDKPFSW
ncbi:MAG: CsgG/HfaB family protein [Gammaproteobacteria bacterium]|nr:CsgG/HfaB family protein [Gammaproteobacteria bacterium]